MSRYGLAYAAYVGVAIWGLLQSRRERSPASLTVLIVLIVLPLMALRHASLSALGIAVFAGMLGVTAFGLVLTPVFYVVVRKLALRREARHAHVGMTDQQA